MWEKLLKYGVFTISSPSFSHKITTQMSDNMKPYYRDPMTEQKDKRIAELMEKLEKIHRVEKQIRLELLPLIYEVEKQRL